MAESVVLGTVGGAAGVLCAAAITRALSTWQLPIALPVQFDVTADALVFAFAFLVSLVAGITFGVAPARQAARTSLSAAMKLVDEAREGRWAIRDLFVAAHVALCFVLVAACLTALRGLQSALMMPLGMDVVA